MTLLRGSSAAQGLAHTLRAMSDEKLTSQTGSERSAVVQVMGWTRRIWLHPGQDPCLDPEYEMSAESYE
jgi:hypothetical protein